MKKLLISCQDNVSIPLVAGGTKLVPMRSINDLPAILPSSIIDSTDVVSVNVFDGTMSGPPLWEALARSVEQFYSDYSGFVIIADINAMAEAAAALTFSIHGLGKPVLFTASVQRPFDVEVAAIQEQRITFNSQLNLVGALELADIDISGVFIFSKTGLIQGCRAILSAPHANGFDLFYPDEHVVVNNRSSEDPVYLSKFSSDISIVTLAPGFSHETLYDMALADRPAGIIVNSFGGYETVPVAIKNLLEKACAQNCPVILTHAGGPSPFTDENVESGAQRQFPALIVMKNISFPCLTTKFQWVLANREGLQETRAAMQQNFAGEIMAQPTFVYRGIVQGRVVNLTRS